MVVLLLAAGLFIYSSPASAIPTPTSEIRYIETSLDGSHFLYDFTVYSTSVYNGFNIIDLSLDFDPTIEAMAISAPTNWESIGGNGFIFSISYPDVGAEIAPGFSLSGFVFQLDGSIETVPFLVDFTNPAGGYPE